MTKIVYAVPLALGIVHAAGCISAGEGFRTGLTTHFTTTDQRSTLKNEDRYVPPQSPGFH